MKKKINAQWSLRVAAVLVCATLLLLSASARSSQITPPVDAGSLLLQQPKPVQAGSDDKALEGRVGVPPGDPGPVKRHGGPTSDEPTVRVKVFQLKGDITVFSPDELIRRLSAYLGRPLSLADLQQAAQAVTQAYRDRGYFLARAYLPQQDVTEGTVVVFVNEGVWDPDQGIRVQGEGLRLRPQLAVDLMSHASPAGKPLRLDEIERGLRLLNDIPGLRVSANLERGSQPGTLRMALNVQEAEALQGFAMADTHGGRYTGVHRLTLGLLLNGLLGRGEQFALQLTQAPPQAGGGMGFVRLAYSQGIGVSGLRVGLSYSDVRYAVGQELRSLNSKGSARELSPYLRYPLIRSRSQALTVNLAYSHKALRDEANAIRFSDKRVDLLALGLGLDLVDGWAGGGRNHVNITFIGGELDLGRNPASLAADQAAGGRGTQGAFNKLSWSLHRLQNLSPRWTLAAQFSGQAASKSLDSSERFQLGGPSGVRAFPAGEASGDSGVRGSLEARYAAGRLLGMADWGLKAFYDWGHIRSRSARAAPSPPAPGSTSPPALASPPNSEAYSLRGAGVGVSLSMPRSWELRAEWAQQVGGNPGASPQGRNDDGSTQRSQLWLNLSTSF